MRTRAFALTAVVFASSFALFGCAPSDGVSVGAQPTRTPVAAMSASPTVVEFASQFTQDGSVALSIDAADQLEVRLDVWASSPKLTGEWTTENEKSLGFAINVRDHRVDEKAVLTEKRRVYASDIQITSQTTATATPSQSPFEFSADARTLVPTDALRSDRGLLLNTFQGGLLGPITTIGALAEDTYGLTLTFTMTLWIESSANDEDSFMQQTITKDVPIAIFPAPETAAGDPEQ